MTIVLFEDDQCDRLRPAGLFRPLCDLQIGSLTLSEMVRRLDIPVVTLIRDHFLVNNHVNPDIGSLKHEPVLFLNASVEPNVRYSKVLRDLISAGDPFITTSGNRVASAFVPPGKQLPSPLTSTTIGSCLLDLGLPLERELFKTIDWPHMIVESHLSLFSANLDYLLSLKKYNEMTNDVFLGNDATLSPSTAFDTAKGPIVIDDRVTIRHFTYLEGPVFIGSDTRIIEHSSIKDRTTIGNVCKVGGEVEASTIASYSNKQHHGFLGHSWVGRWVNLGAGTTTSDLKNTYGAIRVEYGGKRIETGMQFLGSVIGDYVKTAVNTSLFTGKVVGACSMIYGTVTTNVPSFSNYARIFGKVTEISLDQVLTTQERMFARRKVTLTPDDVELMRRVFDLTRNERTISEEQIHF